MQKKYILVLLMLFCIPYQLFAHPHAFIEMHNKPIVEEGKLLGFSMRWTLDEMSSAAILYDMRQNRGNPTFLQKLTDEAMANIVNEHYFSYLFDQKGNKIKYQSQPKNYGMQTGEGKVSYYFDFMLAKPYLLKNTELSLSTYDPTYYVAMYYDLEDKQKSAVDFLALPTHCEGKIIEPQIDEPLRRYASRLDQTQRDEDRTLGVIFAQKVKLLCQ